MKTQDNYIQLAKTILTATHLTNQETGESLELNVNFKLMYGYMRDCYYQYTHTKYAKGYYCESNESIGINIGISEVTVKRNLKLLIQCGLVEVSGGTQSRRIVVKDVNETLWVYSNSKLVDWKATAPERVIKSAKVKEEYKHKRATPPSAPMTFTVVNTNPVDTPPVQKEVKYLSNPFEHEEEMGEDWLPF